MVKFLTYGDYVWIPALAAAVWFSELVALLALWAKDGHPRYQRGEATTVFVSDVLAAHKTFGIIMSSIVAALFILSMFLERWLRHVDRIPHGFHKRQRVLDWLAIACAIIGSAALILLCCFDAFNHSNIHWPMACIFIVFTALSAVFQCAEIFSLAHDHPDRAHLRRNAIYKLIVVVVAILVAIAFAGTYARCHGRANYPGRDNCNTITSAAAGLEWTDAFIVTLFFLTLVLDLFPAAKTSSRHLRRQERQRARAQGLLDNKSAEFNAESTRPSGDVMRQV